MNYHSWSFVLIFYLFYDKALRLFTMHELEIFHDFPELYFDTFYIVVNSPQIHYSITQTHRNH